MPESITYDDGQKEELHEGVLMMSPAPNMNHNIVMHNIVDIFRAYLKGKRCQAFGDHVDVFLDEKKRYQPDVTITCDKDKIRQDGIHGAPDLVVEILSRTTIFRDRGFKKDAYEVAGVKEYWIVDPVSRIIEVYLNSESGFILDKVYGAKVPGRDFDEEIEYLSLKISLYDDLVVDVRDVFSGIL